MPRLGKMNKMSRGNNISTKAKSNSQRNTQNGAKQQRKLTFKANFVASKMVAVSCGNYTHFYLA